MTRYYFHLRDHSEEVIDPEGSEFHSLAALAAYATASARELMASDVKTRGALDLRWRIDVEDESGRIVHTTSFAGAVSIIS